MKLVSTDKDHLEKYHTNTDCPFLPDSYCEMTEADERRNLVHCSHCRDETIASQLHKMGKSV